MNISAPAVANSEVVEKNDPVKIAEAVPKNIIGPSRDAKMRQLKQMDHPSFSPRANGSQPKEPSVKIATGNAIRLVKKRVT